MNGKKTKTMLVSKDVTSTKVSVILMVISSYKLTIIPTWDKDLTRFNKIAIQGTPQMAVD